jgi:hypothetical protein
LTFVKSAALPPPKLRALPQPENEMASHQALADQPSRAQSTAPVLRLVHPSRDYWPRSMLEAFSLRMAGHGLSVSGTMMNCDRRYALEQLGQAHALADSGLREMAMELFRYFERKQSGLGYVN